MLKSIFILCAILAAAILAYAATKPDRFEVHRSASIKASPEKIFAIINDYHNWDKWSPWNKHDPAMTKTISGSASGKGAVYEWAGNKMVGKGRIEIVDSVPSSKITMKLDMKEPMEANNVAEYTLEPKGDMTTVTWALRGPCPYMSKVAGLFMNIDQMVGGAFEEGLASLKALAEK